MLDETLVFHKTDLGTGEIAGAARTLGVKLRRALILVDGVRSVADLAPLFRPGEIDAILEELLAAGHIAAGDAQPASAPASAPAESSSGDGPPFEEARRAAIREIMSSLGPNGDDMAVRIERTTSSAQLRSTLAEAERLVAAMRGEGAAREFVRKLRRDAGA